MNSENLKAAQHYWNYIVPKYPDKPWGRVKLRVRPGAKKDSPWYNQLEDHPRWDDTIEYGFLPETVMIGKNKVPRWFEGELEKCQEYWMVSIVAGKATALRYVNMNPETAKKDVATNTVHLTREATLKHGEAWLALSQDA